MSACKNINTSPLAFSAAIFNCFTLPFGALITLSAYFLAISTVLSSEPPSLPIISIGKNLFKLNFAVLIQLLFFLYFLLKEE